MDVEDLSAVRKVVDTVIRKGDVPPYIPYEFTQQGLMDRIGTIKTSVRETVYYMTMVCLCVYLYCTLHCSNSEQFGQQSPTRPHT